MHYKAYPAELSRLNRGQLNELRKEHFILGKHPFDFQSVSHLAYGDKGMNMMAPVGSQKGTQKSSVQIGDPSLAKTYFQTTYEVSNQARPIGNVSSL